MGQVLDHPIFVGAEVAIIAAICTWAAIFVY
jgi:hypothetical protein